MKKSVPKFINKDSDSEEREREEDELDKGKFDSKDFDRLFKGIKQPALTVFNGDKDLKTFITIGKGNLKYSWIG